MTRLTPEEIRIGVIGAIVVALVRCCRFFDRASTCR
jgi:hypothetical protein